MELENRYIYHFTEQDTFERSKLQNYYLSKPFDRDGFIHCSTRDQVLMVANFIAPKDQSLVLLKIDTEKVTPKIVYENLEGGVKLFPHIYGKLDLEAVVGSERFEADEKGEFCLPQSY